MDGCIAGWIKGVWMDRLRVDGWVDRWMGGWMDG